MSGDLLDQLLSAAQGDGALRPRDLPQFAAALRERAAQILAERVQPIAERAEAFEKESGWRAEQIEGLRREKEAWLQENAQLKADRDAQIAENAALKEEREALLDLLHEERLAHDAELGAARADKQVTADAHDRLFAHHRATLAHVKEALEKLPVALPFGYKRVRAEIESIVAMLSKEVT